MHIVQCLINERHDAPPATLNTEVINVFTKAGYDFSGRSINQYTLKAANPTTILAKITYWAFQLFAISLFLTDRLIFLFLN